jgi:hypothetical protein
VAIILLGYGNSEVLSCNPYARMAFHL